MPKKDDRPGLATYLGIMLSSGADNEVLVAGRQARKIMKAEGLDWHDVAQALEQRDRLLEAARTLKTERDQLLAENERLKRLQSANGAATLSSALWQPAGMPTTVDNRHATWLLNLDVTGRIGLSTKERAFVSNCATRRRLTDPMRDWLQDIVRDAIARTGEAPPP